MLRRSVHFQKDSGGYRIKPPGSMREDTDMYIQICDGEFKANAHAFTMVSLLMRGKTVERQHM